MYKLDFEISVSKYKLLAIEKVTIKRSVENIVDTAEIVLPAAKYNQPLNYDDCIKQNDAVTVKLGYNGNLTEEFSGYIREVATDGGYVTLKCEDSLSLFRVEVPNMEIKPAKVSQILNAAINAVNAERCTKITLSCDYDFSYDKFVISKMTAYDIVKKIQDEAKPNIYLKGDVLHVHPQYAEIFGSAKYDFAKNIDRDGTDLRYKKASDRKLLVTAEGKSSAGKTVKVQEGIPGGDSKTLKLPGVQNESSLRLAAKQALERGVYTGYEGSFTGWLIPYCDAGYRVEIKDNEAEYKNGAYYATAVEVEFSGSGGKRKVTLGKKLGDVK